MILSKRDCSRAMSDRQCWGIHGPHQEVCVQLSDLVYFSDCADDREWSRVDRRTTSCHPNQQNETDTGNRHRGRRQHEGAATSHCQSTGRFATQLISHRFYLLVYFFRCMYISMHTKVRHSCIYITLIGVVFSLRIGWVSVSRSRYIENCLPLKESYIV